MISENLSLLVLLAVFVACIASFLWRLVVAYVTEEKTKPPFWVRDGVEKEYEYGEKYLGWGPEAWAVPLGVVGILILSTVADSSPKFDVSANEAANNILILVGLITALCLTLRSLRFFNRLLKKKAIHTHEDGSGASVSVKELW